MLSVERGRQKNRKLKSKGRSKSKARGKTDGKIKGNCWNCGKPGHRKINCKEADGGYKGKQESDEEADVVATDDDWVYGDMCLSASVDVYGDWFIDSAASFHCTSNRDYFHDYVIGDFGNVTVRNGEKCEVVGKGTILFKLPDGCHLKLNEARRIPELKKNLISACKLD